MVIGSVETIASAYKYMGPMGDSQASPSMVVGGDLGSHSWVTGLEETTPHAPIPHTLQNAPYHQGTRAGSVGFSARIFGLGICGSCGFSGYMAPAVAEDGNFQRVAWVAPWLHDLPMAEAIYGGADAVAGLMAASQAQGAGDETRYWWVPAPAVPMGSCTRCPTTLRKTVA